ncbi:MAG: cold shock domain-containing protein [Clostridiales bacterium]|nr:cold shock domain-containing protein [Clostridiales bacterium]
MRGVVKAWYPERGYGFVTGDDSQDYFVHWSEILMESRRKKLEVGGRVTFDAQKTDRGTGWMAVAVQPDRCKE